MRSLIALLLALLFLVSSGNAAEPKVYALVIGDATPAAHWGKLLPNITLDILAIQVALWDNLPKDQLELITLTLEEDADARPANILAGLERLKPGENDTLLVYFTGHGAVDDHGHFFSLAGGKLYREDLKREMLSRKARLTVLISDCCNVRSDGMSYIAPAPLLKRPSLVSPAFASLLLKPQGLVDLNGSSPGESSFFTPEDRQGGGLPGSLFTKALVEYLRTHQKHSPKWNDLLVDVGNKVHIAFRAGYPQGASIAKGNVVQHDQTVYAIAYPEMPEKQGPRTGVKVRDQEGTGAWIFEVDPQSPAARVYDLTSRKYVSLQPGQLITVANGHRVTGAADLATLVKASPQILRFSASDSRGEREYLMRLRY